MKAFELYGDKLAADAAVQNKTTLNALFNVLLFLVPSAALFAESVWNKRQTTFEAYDSVWESYRVDSFHR
jgi:hypothetical protein